MRDTLIRAAAVAAVLVFAAASAGCGGDTTSVPGWTVGSDTGGNDTRGPGADTTRRDTGTDTTEETDSTSGPWTGWYRRADSGDYFVEGSRVRIVTGSPGSVAPLCQVSFEPASPKWTVRPRPAAESLWRLRQPAATAGAGARPPLSAERVGLVEVDGQKLQTGPSARVQNARVAPRRCRTLRALGRCAVPNGGDVCYQGISTFSEDDVPVVTLDTNAGGQDPRRTRLEYDFYIDFAPRVADAGRFVTVDLKVRRFGPADGTLHDWRLSDVLDATITRNCTSWGRRATVRYSASEANGWMRRIPAHDREGSKSLVVLNLRTSRGTRSGGGEPQADAGPGGISCSTRPLELWVGVEYRAGG